VGRLHRRRRGWGGLPGALEQAELTIIVQRDVPQYQFPHDPGPRRQRRLRRTRHHPRRRTAVTAILDGGLNRCRRPRFRHLVAAGTDSTPVSGTKSFPLRGELRHVSATSLRLVTGESRWKALPVVASASTVPAFPPSPIPPPGGRRRLQLGDEWACNLTKGWHFDFGVPPLETVEPVSMPGVPPPCVRRHRFIVAFRRPSDRRRTGPLGRNAHGLAVGRPRPPPYSRPERHPTLPAL
jgi:hypothetical protein